MSVVFIGAVYMGGSLFFVFVQNPQRYANIGGVKGISWNDNNGFNQIIFNQFSTDFVFFATTRQSTIGKNKPATPFSESLDTIFRIQP